MRQVAFNVIGVDVGGTKTAAGCVSFPEGVTRFRRVVPTRAEHGGRAVLDDIVRLAAEVTAEARAVGARVQAVGLGLCELVGSDGRVLSANSFDWRELPVHERLSAFAPFTLEADVRAAALAEARFGAGRGLRIFLYLTVGTGISSCLMVDGKPFLGARGATGTMGSSSLSVTCERCGDLNAKTLEELASGPALVAAFNRRGARAQSGQEVLAAAAAGDEAALTVVHKGAEALGMIAGLLIGTLDPEALIVGGGLGLSQGPYWESFCAATRRHIWAEVQRELPVLRASTGVDAGLIGAAAAAWEQAGACS